MTDSVCGGCFRQTAKTSEREEALQLIAQEGDNALGPDDAHHAALRIDHRKCVEVVLIEPLGESFCFISGGQERTRGSARRLKYVPGCAMTLTITGRTQTREAGGANCSLGRPIQKGGRFLRKNPPRCLRKIGRLCDPCYAIAANTGSICRVVFALPASRRSTTSAAL